MSQVDFKSVRDYDDIRAALSGISPVSLFVEARGDRSVTDPEVVGALDALAGERWRDSNNRMRRGFRVICIEKQDHIVRPRACKG